MIFLELVGALVVLAFILLGIWKYTEFFGPKTRSDQ